MLTIFLFFSFFISVFFVSAYKIEVGIPGAVKSGDDVNYTQYINGIYNFAFSIIGLVAFGSLVMAGIMYMTSVAVGEISEAKSRIWNTIGGIFLALGGYLLLNAINSGLTNVSLEIKPLPHATTPTTPASTTAIPPDSMTGLTTRCCYLPPSGPYSWKSFGEGKLCEDLTPLQNTGTDDKCTEAGLGPKP